MEAINVLTQEEMDNFIQSVHWGHAFVREIYGLTPSYKTRDGSYTVNPDTPPDLFILIITDDKRYPGVELIFKEIVRLDVSFEMDLKLKGTVEEDRLGHKNIQFSLGTDTWIRALKMSYRYLGEEVLGNTTRYGYITDM